MIQEASWIIMSWLRWVCWAGALTGAGGLIFSYVYPRTMAIILSIAVKLFMSKTVKQLKMSKISFIPLYIEDLELEVRAVGKDPDISMSWKKFAVHVNFHWFMEMLARRLSYIFNQEISITPHPLLRFEFHELHMKSESMMFKHFLEPSAKAQPPKPNDFLSLPANLRRFRSLLIAARLLRMIARLLTTLKNIVLNSIFLLFEVKFLTISFDFNMPVHKCSMHGYADLMIIMFMHSKVLGHEGFTLLNIIQGGSMEVLDEGLAAVHYAGKAARISVDLHHPTQMMDVYINLYGNEDDMAVHVKPFLSLYTKYQRAEDDSLETKLSRGLPTSGKMSIYMEFEHMKVSVKDERCPRLLIINIEHVKAEMASFKLTMDNKRTHKGKLCDMSQKYADRMIPPLLQNVYNIGSNMEKVMKMYCGRAVFQASRRQEDSGFASVHSKYNQADTQTRYTVLEGRFDKVLQVKQGGDYIDEDQMTIHAKSANFEHTCTDLFNWLVVLQDTSERLPSSRFSHRKNNKMKIMIDYFVFSIQPFAHDHDAYSPTNADKYSYAKLSPLLLPHIPLDEYRWACYTLSKMSVFVERRLDVHNNTSHYSMEIDHMTIHTYTPQSDLCKQRNLHTAKEYHHDGNQSGRSYYGVDLKADSDTDEEDYIDLSHNFSSYDIRSEVFEELIGKYQRREIRHNGQAVVRQDDIYLVSIWTFENFTAAFWLGAKMEFNYVKSKRFSISMDTFSWPRSLQFKQTHYEILNMTHNVPDKNGLEVIWIVNSMAVAIDNMCSNVSLAGALSLLSAFSTIRQSVNRVNFTINLVKQRAPDLSNAMIKTIVPAGSHYLTAKHSQSNMHPSRSNAKLDGEGKIEELPVESTSRVAVREMLLIIAAENDSNANHVDSEMQEDIKDNRHNHIMTVLVQNMAMESRGDKMGVQFIACDFRLSKYPMKSFLTLHNFSAEKTKVGASTSDNKYKEDYDEIECSMDKVVYQLHPLMEVGVMMDSLLLQYNAYKVAVGTHTNALDEVFNPLEGDKCYNVELDVDEDDFLVYTDALQEGDLEKSGGREHSTPPSNPGNLESKNSCYIAKLKVNKMEVNFDAPWENIYKNDLLTIAYYDMTMEIDNTLPFTEIEDLISILDIGEENVNTATSDMVLRYGGVAGGSVKFTCAKFEMNLLIQKEVLLSVIDLSFSGPMYNASVIDERIPVEIKLIDVNNALLVDKARVAAVYKKQKRQFGQSNKARINETSMSEENTSTSPDSSWSVTPVRGVPFFVLHSVRQGSSKIYFDMSVSCKEINLHIFPDSMKGVNIINTVIEICQPPNRDPSPIMPAWDTMRYFLHGPFTVQVGKLGMYYHSQDYMQQEVLLKIEILQYHLYIDKSNLEVSSRDIHIEAELNTMILTRRVRAARSNQRIKHVAKFAHIPSFVLAMQHRYHEDYISFMKLLHNKNVYTHHDVYLLPAVSLDSLNDLDTYEQLYGIHEPPEKEIYLSYIQKDLMRHYFHDEFLPFLPYIQRDKFYFFRSRPCSSVFNIELRLANGINRHIVAALSDEKSMAVDDKLPILLFFRIDNLVRVMDALSHNGPAHYSTAASSRHGAPIRLHTNGLAKSPRTFSLGQMAHSFDVTMVINRALLVSWPARTCLLGIILHQQLSELQIRINRKISAVSNQDNNSPSNVKSPRASRLSPRASGTSPTSESFYLNGTVDLGKRLVPEIDDKEYPMQIDHMVTDIYFAEIYARNLNLVQADVENELVKYNVPTMLKNSSRQSAAADFSRNSFGINGGMRQSTSARNNLGLTSGADEDGQIVEPNELQHVYSLMRNIRKLAYASKVIISLTENGSVASKLNTFVSTGILSVIDEADDLEAFYAQNSLHAASAKQDSKIREKRDSSGFLIGKEWRRFSQGDNPVNKRRLTALRRSNIGVKSSSFNRRQSNSITSLGSFTKQRRKTMIPMMSPVPITKSTVVSREYRASLFSFTQNHAAFTPPYYALPISYVRNHNASDYLNSIGVKKQAAVEEAKPEEVDSFGNKIWGLSVIDTKFLFTIDIRDSLFIYVSRSADFITAGTNDENQNVDPENEKYVHKGNKNMSENNSDGDEDSVKNIDIAVMNATPFSARRGSKRLVSQDSTTKASLSDFIEVAEEPSELSPSIHQHIEEMHAKREIAVANNSDTDSVAESTIVKHLLSVPEERSKLHGHFDFTAATTSRATEEEEKDDEIAMAPDVLNDKTFAGTHRVYTVGGRRLKRSTAVYRGSLFNKSIRVDQGEADEIVLNRQQATPRTLTKDKERKQGDLSGKASKGSKRTNFNQPFFKVELVDPQLNFLDTESHSSLLIVAGKSTLEGKRLNCATLPSLGNANSVVADTEEHLDMNTPKRRQEIRLRMDNVSAYTVPTQAGDEDEDDEVYWKNTLSAVESYQLRPLQGHSKNYSPKALTKDIFFVKPTEEDKAGSKKRNKNMTINTDMAAFSSSPDSFASLGSNTSTYHAPPSPRKVYKFRPDKLEPATMQMAIKDFQIRAVYIFWTDVTVSEAKDLKIIRSKEDLICTFRLELPNLTVDVNSKQFHIVMNVMKNVLLKPPPHLQNKRTAAESTAASNNVIELQRNPEILQKYEIKAGNAALDINSKSARDEIKAYIDDCLGSNLFDLSNQQTVRYMEVFIGRLTWVLRNSTLATSTPAPSTSISTSNPTTTIVSSANSFNASNKVEKEYEQVESGFIGIYSTLTFTRSRCINSLLEIQRFWAKNIDSAADSAALSLPTNPSIGSGGINDNNPAALAKTTSAVTTDRNVVLKPVLVDEEYCARCHCAFLIEENQPDACSFHADDDGNPGVFKTIVIKDDLTGEDTAVEGWTCCRRLNQFAPGCSKRPHICKEVMFSIRAEVYPTAKIEDVKVTVLKTLDVSIFPGANYDLKLQVTRSLNDFLHKYFSLESVEGDVNNLDNASEGSGVTSSDANALATRRPSRTVDSLDSSTGSDTNKTTKKRKSLISFIKKKTIVRRFTQVDPSAESPEFSPNGKSRWTLAPRRSTAQMGSNAADGNGLVPLKGGANSGALVVGSHEGKGGKQKNMQEGLYIKYLRVGDINVDVSTLGFAFNLDKFKAVMEPFFCRGEVLTWTKLIWQFERHVVWSLTKHTATTGLNKLGEFLRINNKVQNMQLLLQDEKIDPEKALAVKRAMLLGSPVPEGKSRSESTSRARTLTGTTLTSNKSPVRSRTPVNDAASPSPNAKISSLSVNLFQREKKESTVVELKEDQPEQKKDDTKNNSKVSVLGTHFVK